MFLFIKSILMNIMDFHFYETLCPNLNIINKQWLMHDLTAFWFWIVVILFNSGQTVSIEWKYQKTDYRMAVTEDKNNKIQQIHWWQSRCSNVPATLWLTVINQLFFKYDRQTWTSHKNEPEQNIGIKLSSQSLSHTNCITKTNHRRIRYL